MLGNSDKAPDLPKFEGHLPRLAIVTCTELGDLTEKMAKGAKDLLKDGYFETESFKVAQLCDLAPAVAMAVRSGRFEGYVALGAIVESDSGEDVVFGEVLRALGALGSAGNAVSHSILYDQNRKALTKRIAGRKLDPGGNAARAALGLIAIARQMVATPPPSSAFKPASEFIQMADSGSTQT